MSSPGDRPGLSKQAGHIRPEHRRTSGDRAPARVTTVRPGPRAPRVVAASDGSRGSEWIRAFPFVFRPDRIGPSRSTGMRAGCGSVNRPRPVRDGRARSGCGVGLCPTGLRRTPGQAPSWHACAGHLRAQATCKRRPPARAGRLSGRTKAFRPLHLAPSPFTPSHLHGSTVTEPACAGDRHAGGSRCNLHYGLVHPTMTPRIRITSGGNRSSRRGLNC